MKSKPVFKPLITSVILLTIGCCLIGVVTVFPLGFADFPCFIDYDKQASCIQADTEMDILDLNENARIHVFLNTYDVRFAGGGCNYKNSTDDNLEVTTKFSDFKFERKGDNIEVNGQVVAEGDKFQYIKFWNPNPWTIYSMEFQHYGLTSVCESNAPPGLFIMGSYGSELAPEKAGVSLVISIVLVLTYHLIKNKLGGQT